MDIKIFLTIVIIAITLLLAIDRICKALMFTKAKDETAKTIVLLKENGFNVEEKNIKFENKD